MSFSVFRDGKGTDHEMAGGVFWNNRGITVGYWCSMNLKLSYKFLDSVHLQWANIMACKIYLSVTILIKQTNKL